MARITSLPHRLLHDIVVDFGTLLLPATSLISATLDIGSTTPVGGVTNVVVPAAGGTDTTGKVTGWAATSACNIKFVVVDGGSATSTISINGNAYTNGADYTITATGNLTIVVTTSEIGRYTVLRTFTVAVSGTTLTIGDQLGGGYYIGKTYDYSGTMYNLILSPYNAQSAAGDGTDLNVGGTWPEPNKSILGTDQWDGNQNTNYIPTTSGNSTNGTANYFRDLVYGGYSDWYWPSHNEMGVLSAALNSGLLPSAAYGPYLNSFRYWSSTTEFSTLINPTRFIYYAWAMDSNSTHIIFKPRSDGTNGSMISGRVRCVRRQPV